MKIQQFSQQGKRSNNEDSLGTSESLLTVCDGMGGHNYGERASAFVKDAMLKAFAKVQPLGKMEIQQQLTRVQIELNMLLETEPELEKMGTTFTGVFRTPDVWYAAHIGDSRIYLFRPSEQKLWHTWDHSLVGELMRTHEITVEAGRFHPMSNRISKAIIAQKDSKPSTANIVKIDELKAGDILLLCSDGVIEAWGDIDFVHLFSDNNLSFEQKCKRLAKQCEENSKDNNTAIIVEVEAEDAFAFGTNDELEWTTFDDVEADYKQYLKDNGETEEEETKDETDPMEENEIAQISHTAENISCKRNPFQVLMFVLVLLVAILVVFLIFFNNKPIKSGKTTNNIFLKAKAGQSKKKGADTTTKIIDAQMVNREDLNNNNDTVKDRVPQEMPNNKIKPW